MGTTLEHLLGEGAIAVQGVRGNDTAFERKHLQHFQGALGLVAARRLARGQGHAGFGSEDIDHVQRRSAAAPLVGPSNRLAIDRHHPGELDPVGLCKCCHKASKGPLESLRIERVEDPAEGIVTGNSVRQSKELPQQLFFGGCKHLHIRRTLSPTQHRGQCDDDDVEQIVQRIGRARVGQCLEYLSDSLHWTPSASRESPSESISLARAIPPSNPHAIPLPWRGRVAAQRRGGVTVYRRRWCLSGIASASRDP